MNQKPKKGKKRSCISCKERKQYCSRASNPNALSCTNCTRFHKDCVMPTGTTQEGEQNLGKDGSTGIQSDAKDPDGNFNDVNGSSVNEQDQSEETQENNNKRRQITKSAINSGSSVKKPLSKKKTETIDLIYDSIKNLSEKLLNNNNNNNNSRTKNDKSAVQSSTNGGSHSSVQLDFYCDISPSSVIHGANALVPYKANTYECNVQRHFEEFYTRFNEKKTLYLDFASKFLAKCSPWVIPGGIKKIDPEYVYKNTFISMVFMLIGSTIEMSTAQKIELASDQNYLFHATVPLAGQMLLLDKLSSHEIEALMYLSIFNVRNTNKNSNESFSQYDLNSLQMLNAAFDRSLISFKFETMYNNIECEKEPNDDYIFHIRIFTSLLIYMYQAHIELGREKQIAKDFLDFTKLILKIPKVQLRDRVNVSKLAHLRSFMEILRKDTYVENILRTIVDKNGQYIDEELEIIRVPEFEAWKESNKPIIKTDASRASLNNYYYHYIILMERIEMNIKVKEVSGNDSIRNIIGVKKGYFYSKSLSRYRYRTIIFYCFRLLTNFAKVIHTHLECAPSNHYNNIIYACVLLGNLLPSMEETNVQTAQLVLKHNCATLCENLKKMEFQDQAIHNLKNTFKKLLNLIEKRDLWDMVGANKKINEGPIEYDPNEDKGYEYDFAIGTNSNHNVRNYGSNNHYNNGMFSMMSYYNGMGIPQVALNNSNSVGSADYHENGAANVAAITAVMNSHRQSMLDQTTSPQDPFQMQEFSDINAIQAFFHHRRSFSSANDHGFALNSTNTRIPPASAAGEQQQGPQQHIQLSQSSFPSQLQQQHQTQVQDDDVRQNAYEDFNYVVPTPAFLARSQSDALERPRNLMNYWQSYEEVLEDDDEYDGKQNEVNNNNGTNFN